MITRFREMASNPTPHPDARERRALRLDIPPFMLSLWRKQVREKDARWM